MRSRQVRRLLPAVVAVALLAGGCASGSSGGADTTAPTGIPTTTPSAQSPEPPKTGGPIPPEPPVPAESNPPGDIPDNTAFVPYRSKSGGFTISVPEGWARTTTDGSVSFTDKLNSISVTWRPASAAPTVSSATSTEVPQLRKTERAFRVGDVTTTSLPEGEAVLVTFQENSAPNSVTGKQYRLDVLRFELFKSGVEAVITLSSPVGADNVDPWRTVSESFAWA